MTGQRAARRAGRYRSMIRFMSTNSTLALVISILSASAAAVLITGIRAVVEVVRVRSGKDGQPPGRIKV